MPLNRVNRNPKEELEHASYEGLTEQWVSASDLKAGDRVVLAQIGGLTEGVKYGIVKAVKTEESESYTTYNFEVEDYHTYFVGKTSVCVHNAGCSLTNRQMNALKKEVLKGKDINVKSKEQALEFINKKFSNFHQEIAGARSSQGWHFDYHPINGSINSIEHINLYSKIMNFRVHITWL